MRDSGGRFFHGLLSYGSLSYGSLLWFFPMARGFSFYGCRFYGVVSAVVLDVRSLVFLSPRRGELGTFPAGLPAAENRLEGDITTQGVGSPAASHQRSR
jgi:hypothetical protein